MENPLKKFKSSLKGFHNVDLRQTSYLIKSDTSGVIKMLRELSHHHDCRLRSSALETLYHLHGEGTTMDISLYTEFCESLKDNYGGCRLTAMKLLEIMAQTYGDCLCSGMDDDQIRLADDTFAKICNMMSDIEMSVRIQAATLLGKFTNVSTSFLDQTLDKKLMSNLRKKKSAHERNRESAAAGEWSSGKKWADDAPQEEVCPESVNLMDIGACGAFVHGLEDEFLEVRMATLESITSLAEIFPNFAHQSLDFIVDMFNDEIEEIRLKAIKCLQKISSTSSVVLREDQVDIILSALEDHNCVIREALHDLIGSCQMESTSALRSSIELLSNNLNKNPKDKPSIWKCFMNLGLHHPQFVSTLVNELIGIHPFLELPEPSLEDCSYLNILILILNAASKMPSILSQLERYTPRHYSYLRHAHPNLVPIITLYDKDEISLIPDDNSSARSDRHTKAFLTNIFKRIKNSTSNEQVEVQKSVFELAIKDLERLSHVESSMKAACDFLRDYLSCQLSIRKILLNNNWINAFLLSPLQSSHFRSSLQQILVLTFLLKYRFHGAHPIQTTLVQQTRVKALALQLMAIIYGSNASALALCGAFIEELDHLRNHLNSSGIKADPLTEAMMKEIKSLEEPKPGSVARVLQPLFLSSQSLTSQLADVVSISSLLFNVTISKTFIPVSNGYERNVVKSRADDDVQSKNHRAGTKIRPRNQIHFRSCSLNQNGSFGI